jgi:hypothetical protein
MKTDAPATLTIFRKFHDGEVVALFPYLPHDANGIYCVSYLHIGQHGAADTSITRTTKPATPSEYAPLARELESIGYVPQIRQRIPANAYQVRRAAVLK